MRGKIVNRAELARICGVVPSTINKWEENGCPVVKKGRIGMPAEFNTVDVLDWRIERALSLNNPSSATERKARANAGIAEMKLKAALDAVVLVDVAAETFNTRLATIAERIDTVARKIADQVAQQNDPRRCEVLIRQAINEVRRQIVAAGEHR
jgi:phage terminase Nu1 subunit (DNA packaging protein)